MRSKLLPSLKSVGAAALTIFIALLLGAVLIAISGENPFNAYRLMINGAFGSAHKISETLVKAVPLMIMALGTSIAFKNQLWNIGGDGQFTLGAIFALAAGIYLPLPAAIVLPLSIVAAFIGGGLWAGIAGWLKTQFNANEVITTLMLNYVATYLLAYLVYGPMMDPEGFGFPQTPLLPESIRLPLFSADTRIHMGVFVVLILLVLMMFFWRSTLGYKIELMGQGQQVARYAGVKVKSTMIIAMVLSGGLAGIAGWNEIYGVHYRLMTDIASGYGSLAIVIALLGNLNPIGIAVSSFFFSVLLVGGNTMQRMTEIPYSIVDVIEALVIIFVITRSMMRLDVVKNFFKRFGVGGKKHA
jgi:simple sugar transport system permease protein